MNNESSQEDINLEFPPISLPNRHLWNKEDIWFAWFPVRLGALGNGKIAWMRKVWRNRCLGATIYQDIE
jgi:hypothetical protein